MDIRKLCSFVLTAALIVGLLASCGGEPVPPANDDTQQIENVTTAPQDDIAETDETTSADPEAQAIPDGWQECRFVTGLNDNDWNRIDGKTEIIFAVPDDWIYGGYSTISGPNYKMMELFGSFLTDGFDVAGARYFPEGTEYPAVGINDMGNEFTVLKEVESEGLYDLMSHRISIADGGYSAYYEVYEYLVSRNGYSAYIFFVVNDDYDESVCQTILETVRIEAYIE